MDCVALRGAINNGHGVASPGEASATWQKRRAELVSI